MDLKLEDIAKDLVRSKTFLELVLSLESRGVDVPERELLSFLLREIVVPKMEPMESTEGAYGRNYFFQISPEMDPVNIWNPTHRVLIGSTDVLRGMARIPELVSCLRECVAFLKPHQTFGNMIAEERISFLVDFMERMFPGVVRTVRFGDGRNLVSEIFSALEIVKAIMDYAAFADQPDKVWFFAKDILKTCGCARLISELLFRWSLDPILDGKIPVWEVFGCRDMMDLKISLDVLK